jgi:phenylalanyl-tRNA synthetase beta chain
MKISLNWVKEYTKVDLPLDQLLDKIGSQLGAVEEVVDLGVKYKGLVVARVVSVDPHINADKLHVCLIDDGRAVQTVERFPDDSEPAITRGLVQVVCGANNIKEGQLVIWIPPGSAVPETSQTAKEIVIDTKEVRGIVSNGMIASARELDFGDDHEGIVVVDEDIKPGTTLCEAFGLDDYIIDIENKMFTHRPDCFGILGVAREIAGIQGIQFKSPDWYLKEGIGDWEVGTGEKLPLVVKNEAPDLVPRFMAVALDNIQIKQSSLKVKTALARVGVKPINNIVDITNLLMVLTGQPMHAFDYDKVKALSGGESAEIIVRKAKKDEKITLLGGKIIEPREDAILITTPKQIIAIGGVMGGADTEVDNNSKNIILEVANFDMYSIRKTAMAHGLFTDAFTRFSKGQSPLQNDKVLAEAVKMVLQTGGQVASKVSDDNHANLMEPVKITAEFVNERLGLKLTAEEIAKTLQNVEFKVELQTPNSELQITPPFWRTDIVIPEDVVEEVGRLIGFDKISLELPTRDLTPVNSNPELDLNRQIRSILSAGGANELLTYSFVHGNLIDKCGQNRELAYQLNNALSPDLQYYRLSLIPSLLEKVHPNIKAGHDQFALFEIGKAHIKDQMSEENVPQEISRLGFVVAAKKGEGVAYYQALKYLEYLLGKLNVSFDLVEISEKADSLKHTAAPFAANRAALVAIKGTDEIFGVIGEFKSAVKKGLKLPEFCAGFEIDLFGLDNRVRFDYQPLSKYPKVEQDISLKVPVNVNFGQLEQLLNSQLSQLVGENMAFEVIPLDIYQPESVDFKHFTFRVSVVSYSKTLQSQEVNHLLDKVADAAGKEFKAVRL